MKQKKIAILTIRPTIGRISLLALLFLCLYRNCPARSESGSSTEAIAYTLGDSFLSANDVPETPNDTLIHFRTARLPLPAVLKESSGLIFWNGRIWSHNDSGGAAALYAFDPEDPSQFETYPLDKVKNIDWEEISQDERYIYIGDTGNNSAGNRKDLQILRIGKSSLLQEDPQIETISFSYEDQTDFSPRKNNQTDFDCEAFIVSGDSIFLFTKQWISNETALYALPNTPGKHVAVRKGTFPVEGLVTGATYLKDKNLLALCGYSRNYISSFVYLFCDFPGNDFFNGTSKKYITGLVAHQIEGIATADGRTFYLSNEQVNGLFFSIDPLLHTFDLGATIDLLRLTR